MRQSETQTTTFVDVGRTALTEGRWADASAAYTAALDVEQNPDAMDGLGEALWWLGEPRESLVWRERAYAGFVRDQRYDAATMAAIGVALTYESNFANAA